MKILWLCNMALPAAARQFGMEASNKEGWLSGLADMVRKNQGESGIVLSVAFPLPSGLLGGRDVRQEVLSFQGGSFRCYGFRENVAHAEKYDPSLEPVMKKIVNIEEPDLVHCFGTEYPHTLAMCRVFPRKDRLLVGLQGLCTLYARAYYGDLPEEVVRSVTFRDCLKRDTLRQQQEKFVRRGETERESLGLAGNVTGRTDWDREFARKWNPDACYHPMNETLRREFYGPVWQEGKCIPHSIFVSQGDYPLKGLHYVLLALPRILEKFPAARVYVAGGSLVEYKTLRQKLKLSAYGRYLRRLLARESLGEKVVFLGRLDAGQMRDRFLESSLYVCPSALENSPNSLGEAMLLGMPCVSADVGGIPSIFTGGEDGILYEGFREAAGTAGGDRLMKGTGTAGEGDRLMKGTGTAGEGDRLMKGTGTAGGDRLMEVAGNLAEAVIEMWSEPGRMRTYCQNARRHARITHDGDRNYQRLVEIYTQICGD